MRNNKHRDKQIIQRLVWILAAVGLSAGAIMLGMEHRALTKITEYRNHTQAALSKASESFQALRAEREVVVRGIETHFAEEHRDVSASIRKPDSLVPLMARCKADLSELSAYEGETNGAVANMEQAIAALLGIHTRLVQWECDYIALSAQVLQASKRVDQELAELKSEAHKLEGRKRLQEAMSLKRFHNSAEDEQAEIAISFVKEQEATLGASTLVLELSDLALQVERLRSEEHVDHLVSLKDNEMRQTLRRLRDAAARVDTAGVVDLTLMVDNAQDAIFGDGSRDDPDHQTLMVGVGGLYQHYRKQLLLQSTSAALQKSVIACVENFTEAEHGLGSMLGNAIVHDANRAQHIMRAAWRDALLAGVLVAVAFLVLTWKIAGLGEAAEAQLNAKNHALEATMEQLQIATHDAEAASRSKSDFLANMSHEIRTPMTAILGFTDVLRSTADDQISVAQRKDAIETIERNGTYLLQIINDILDISKIEAGKLDVQNIRTPLVPVIAEICSLMKVRADLKNLPFSLAYTESIPECIHTDPIRLKQILVNLIGNAVKFTESGSVKLVVGFDSSDAESKIHFDVIDTGPGMTRAQLDKLFKPFTQVDTSATRSFGGTGLGLAISRRLAMMLGGSLTVASEPGKGSRFRITVSTGPLDGIRMLDNPLEATSIKAEPAPAKKDTVLQLNCRILLAEDGVDNQRLIAHVLRKAGADVTVVENGKLAVEAALGSAEDYPGDSALLPFDVILMDMQMPVMDGYQATQVLRERGYTGPIIALTAHAMIGDRERCIEAGCSDYDTKPIDRIGLIKKITSWLSKATSDAEHEPALHETAMS
ncbi:MAG: response regulator [Phycisphaerales bacterium]|nr:response regulator [Phycisphaerales bacterium]